MKLPAALWRGQSRLGTTPYHMALFWANCHAILKWSERETSHSETVLADKTEFNLQQMYQPLNALSNLSIDLHDL